MVETTNQLITRSWYLSGIVSRSFQTVDGTQLNDGLLLLNSFLQFKSADITAIPYYKEHDFLFSTGVEKNYIEGLLNAETLTYEIGNGGVRYPIDLVSRDEYFGPARANKINSLPFMGFAERCLGGSNLYVYFKPASDYAAKITGKFALSSVELWQDLSLVLDGFYLEYLRFSLAGYMCMEYGYSLSPEAASYLKMAEKTIKQVDSPDMSGMKLQMIDGPTDINYGIVNLSNGWIGTE